jgi:hypothetical protein
MPCETAVVRAKSSARANRPRGALERVPGGSTCMFASLPGQKTLAERRPACGSSSTQNGAPRARAPSRNQFHTGAQRTRVAVFQIGSPPHHLPSRAAALDILHARAAHRARHVVVGRHALSRPSYECAPQVSHLKYASNTGSYMLLPIMPCASVYLQRRHGYAPPQPGAQHSARTHSPVTIV